MFIRRSLVIVLTFMISILTFPASNALAESISVDVIKELNDVLSTKSVVVKSRVATRKEQRCIQKQCRNKGDAESCATDGPVCHMIDVPYIEKFSDHLKITRLNNTIVSEIKFAPTVLNSLPTKIRGKSFRNRNCTEVSQTTSGNMTLNLTKSHSFSVTRSLNTGTNLTTSLTYKLSDELSGSTSVAFSKNISVGEGSVDSSSESFSETETINRLTPPMTEMWGEMRIIEYSAYAPFSVVVMVDGPVDANENGIGKLSDILSEKERTFYAEGRIDFNYFSDTTVNYYSRAVSKEGECRSNIRIMFQEFDSPYRLIGNGITLDEQILSGGANGLQQQQGSNLTEAVSDAFVVQKSEKNIVAPEIFSAGQTPNARGGGTHQCQSATDIGHRCDVSVFGASDCDEATSTMRRDDCCPLTKSCAPGPDGFECRYGGVSIGFSLNYCVLF